MYVNVATYATNLKKKHTWKLPGLLFEAIVTSVKAMRVKSLQNDIREQAKQDWEERDESKQKDIWYKKASGPKNTNSDGLVCTWLRLLYLHRVSISTPIMSKSLLSRRRFYTLCSKTTLLYNPYLR